MQTIFKNLVSPIDKRVIICCPTLKHRKAQRSVFGGNGDCSTEQFLGRYFRKL